MGEMERSLKVDIRRTRVTSAVLATIAATGVLAIALVAPNALTLLKVVSRSHQRIQTATRALTRLIERGYVREENVGTQKVVHLTDKGEKFLALVGEGQFKLKKPKKWDGKWRVLIFDIPERRRRAREQIRLKLLRLGFCRLQDSVWVIPYDCEDLIALLKVDLRIGKDLLYIIADKIENDRVLRRHFLLR